MNETRDTSAQKSVTRRGIAGLWSSWSVAIKRIAIIVALGVLAGTQIASPKKRVIEAIVALGIMAVLWNFSTFAALSFVILMYPFPFGISMGNSNFILTLIIFMIYLIRVTSHIETIRSDKMYNLPIALMILSYFFSFYNFVPTPIKSQMAKVNTLNFLAAVLFFYLIINLVDSEQRLRRIVKIMMITVFLVNAFTIFEFLLPGRVIVPGWLSTQHRAGLVVRDVRMGGPFLDFELFAEFCAINIPIICLMFVRARRLLMKYVYGLLLLTVLFMLFSTMTRGAFISLSVGVIYLVILSRRDLTIVRATTGFAVVIAIIIVLEGLVSRYTVSGSLFGRLFKTTLVHGVIPDSRSYTWSFAYARGMLHPILGHGPGWDFSRGLDTQYWPHNLYLYYFNITGLFGLISFLFLLYRLFKASLPGFRSSIVTSPFPEALMKALHVCLVIFFIDQIKIEYLRNTTYTYFVWLLFGIIAATHNLIRKRESERMQSVPSPVP